MSFVFLDTTRLTYRVGIQARRVQVARRVLAAVVDRVVQVRIHVSIAIHQEVVQPTEAATMPALHRQASPVLTDQLRRYLCFRGSNDQPSIASNHSFLYTRTKG